MLELKGISKYYNPGTINEMCLFKGFDLTIEKKESSSPWWEAMVPEKPPC